MLPNPVLRTAHVVAQPTGNKPLPSACSLKRGTGATARRLGLRSSWWWGRHPPHTGGPTLGTRGLPGSNHTSQGPHVTLYSTKRRRRPSSHPVGETMRRLVSKRLCRAIKRDARQRIWPLQLGGGASGMRCRRAHGPAVVTAEAQAGPPPAAAGTDWCLHCWTTSARPVTSAMLLLLLWPTCVGPVVARGRPGSNADNWNHWSACTYGFCAAAQVSGVVGREARGVGCQASFGVGWSWKIYHRPPAEQTRSRPKRPRQAASLQKTVRTERQRCVNRSRSCTLTSRQIASPRILSTEARKDSLRCHTYDVAVLSFSSTTTKRGWGQPFKPKHMGFRPFELP